MQCHQQFCSTRTHRQSLGPVRVKQKRETFPLHFTQNTQILQSSVTGLKLIQCEGSWYRGTFRKSFIMRFRENLQRTKSSERDSKTGKEKKRKEKCNVDSLILPETNNNWKELRLNHFQYQQYTTPSDMLLDI